MSPVGYSRIALTTVSDQTPTEPRKRSSSSAVSLLHVFRSSVLDVEKHVHPWRVPIESTAGRPTSLVHPSIAAVDGVFISHREASRTGAAGEIVMAFRLT